MSIEENKKIAKKYHELNPDYVDDILAADFTGWNNYQKGGHEWDRESHRKFLSANLGTMKDEVHEQFGEDERVATFFSRSGVLDGKPYKIDVMHIKRFEKGKIVHIREFLNIDQVP